MKNNKLLAVYFFFICLLFIILSLFVQKVSFFTDGAQHAGTIRYIMEVNDIPDEDFQHIQRNNLNTPVSIRTPFLYPPLFYIEGSVLSLITDSNETFGIILLNILPYLIAGLFLFIIFRKNYNLKIALISFTLFILCNISYWFTVHRLIEPLSLMMFMLLLFLLVNKNRFDQKSIVIILSLILSCLYLIKQTNLLIVSTFIFSLLILKEYKLSLKIIVVTLLFLTPALIYNLSNSGTFGVYPPGVPIIDSLMDPWWQEEVASWETELNSLSNSDNLRERTLSQFKQIQISPQNLIKSQNYGGLIQHFFVYPIIYQGNREYSPRNVSDIYPFYLFLLILCIFYFVEKKSPTFNKNKRSKTYSTFLVMLLLFTLIFWFRFSVFRYFLFFSFLSIAFFALGLYYVLRKVNKMSKILVVFIFFIFTFTILSTEIERDLNYEYTVSHRTIPNQAGGVFETEQAGEFLKNVTLPEENIFSNIPELNYYANRPIIWDDRLFFIEEPDLIDVIKYYNFTYLAIPYYSGNLKKSEWRYNEGIPLDSAFNSLLKDSSYFTEVRKYGALTIYKYNEAST